MSLWWRHKLDFMNESNVMLHGQYFSLLSLIYLSVQILRSCGCQNNTRIFGLNSGCWNYSIQSLSSHSNKLSPLLSLPLLSVQILRYLGGYQNFCPTLYVTIHAKKNYGPLFRCYYTHKNTVLENENVIKYTFQHFSMVHAWIL